ncbi:MAG TPA: prefoldin subunit alpha [Thermococcus sp.]|uniref:prefoldin subunit alpha n=1 Tax=Thermococcus sp. TaxID=35749 RepID=UPI000F24BF49|nr:prefoldin subunit alpha [Thermococcus sp.]RLF77158.1 MAG: prefoldin subunit alpha [Thermococci archaeon]MCD6139365.1 prefoldin subunit alpha [Thermococcus sp.]MCD6144644.1 prefoldin subunit alpha [Thermococcus sp.]RLF80006.1 MAG: prefoldin subunit alpha [Thermococci archaeon]RLF83759.1 MAG: prefoldin subunit alpha [Thermococci archaeon]
MSERNEQLERLAYEYQLLQGQAQLLAQNLELLNLGRNEFQAVKETLEGLKNVEDDKPEILVPIGAGSFLKGRVEDKSNAIVSVGAGYAIEKSLDDAIAYLGERIKEYESAIAKTQEALHQLEHKLQDLAQKAQKLQQQQAMGFKAPKK